MRSCRGIGASLSPEEIEKWEKEHIEMLEKSVSEEFGVLHEASYVVLRRQ